MIAYSHLVDTVQAFDPINKQGCLTTRRESTNATQCTLKQNSQHKKGCGSNAENEKRLKRLSRARIVAGCVLSSASRMVDKECLNSACGMSVDASYCGGGREHRTTVVMQQKPLPNLRV